MNAFAAIEYDHRGELKIKDRDWGIKPFADNLAGGWSSTGMPGTTYLVNPAGNLAGRILAARWKQPAVLSRPGSGVRIRWRRGVARHLQLPVFAVRQPRREDEYVQDLRRIQLRHQRHVEISHRRDVFVPEHAALELVAGVSAELAVRSRSRDSRDEPRTSFSTSRIIRSCSPRCRLERRSTPWRCTSGPASSA